MVLIRCVNVKLLPSSNGYVPVCCLMTAIVVVLGTGSRCDPIHQKYERVIYEFGIQGFLSCLFEVASKLSNSQVTQCCPEQEFSSMVNFQGS
jgi:hypothetical protein